MKITALVENRSLDGLAAVHGLSLYIETHQHRILFDLGPDETLFKNAAALGINLASVDTVILSHGHSDHGGALKRFLEVNRTAKIYAQRSAFDPHYGKALFLRASVGLDAALKNHPQLALLEGDMRIDEELFLFTVPEGRKCWSPANDRLLDRHGPDAFLHEQNLILQEDGHTALIMGCGHAGVVNILEKAAPFAPDLCVGGYHLYDPLPRRTVAPALLDEIANELTHYPGMRFYTCHCTGQKAYAYLAQRIPNMCYLAGGDSVTL